MNLKNRTITYQIGYVRKYKRKKEWICLETVKTLERAVEVLRAHTILRSDRILIRKTIDVWIAEDDL